MSNADAAACMHYLPMFEGANVESTLYSMVQHGSSLDDRGLPTGYTLEVRPDANAYQVLGTCKNLCTVRNAYVARVPRATSHILSVNKQYAQRKPVSDIGRGKSKKRTKKDKQRRRKNKTERVNYLEDSDEENDEEGEEGGGLEEGGDIWKHEQKEAEKEARLHADIVRMVDIFCAPSDWLAKYQASASPPLRDTVKLHQLQIVDFGRSEDLTTDVQECLAVLARWTAFTEAARSNGDTTVWLETELWLPSLHAASPDDNAAGCMPHVTVYLLDDQAVRLQTYSLSEIHLHSSEPEENGESVDYDDTIHNVMKSQSQIEGRSYSDVTWRAGLDVEATPNLMIVTNSAFEPQSFNLHQVLAHEPNLTMQNVEMKLLRLKESAQANADALARVMISHVCKQLDEDARNTSRLLQRIISNTSNTVIKLMRTGPPSRTLPSQTPKPPRPTSVTPSSGGGFSIMPRASEQLMFATEEDAADNNSSSKSSGGLLDMNYLGNEEEEHNNHSSDMNIAYAGISYMFLQNAVHFTDCLGGIIYADNHGHSLNIQTDSYDSLMIDSNAQMSYRTAVQTKPGMSSVHHVTNRPVDARESKLGYHKRCVSPYLSPYIWGSEKVDSEVRHRTRWLCDPCYRCQDSKDGGVSEIISDESRKRQHGAVQEVMVRAMVATFPPLDRLWLVPTKQRMLCYTGSRSWCLMNLPWTRRLYETVVPRVWLRPDQQSEYVSLLAYMMSNMPALTALRDGRSTEQAMSMLHAGLLSGDTWRYSVVASVLLNGILQAAGERNDLRRQSDHPWHDSTAVVFTSTRVAALISAYLQLYKIDTLEDAWKGIMADTHAPLTPLMTSLKSLAVRLLSMYCPNAPSDYDPSTEDVSVIWALFGDDRFFLRSSGTLGNVMILRPAAPVMF